MIWMLREQHRTSFRRLVRALAGSSSGFRFLVATFGDSEYRDGLIAHLDQQISRTSATVAIEPEGGPRGLEERLARAAETAGLIHVVGFEALGKKREEWFNRLNYAREDLADNCPAAVVLWLHDDEATALAEQAPDLWAWRKGIYELTWLVEPAAPLTSRAEDPRARMPLSSTVQRMEEIRRHVSEQEAMPAGTRLALMQELGEHALAMHDHDGALENFRVALDLARESDDQYAVGHLSALIGRTFEATGTLDAALDMLHEAESTFEILGDSRSRDIATSEVARILGLRGALDEALDVYRELLPRFVAYGDLREQAIMLASMARIHGQRGELDEALRLCEEAGTRFEELGERRMYATNLGEIARIHWRKGELDRALELHEEERREFIELGDVRGEAVVLGDIARILRSRGEVDRPLALDRERLEINRAIGNTMGIANAQWAIGRDLTTRDPDQALECFKESYEICVDLGLTDATAKVGFDYGALLISTGQPEAARSVLERALDSLRVLGRDDDAAEVSALLDGLEPGSP